MKVTPIAHTIITPGFIDVIEGTAFADRIESDMIEPEFSDLDALAEFGGRACYQSWHMPNEKTATSAGYMNNTIAKQRHYSILEHSTVTFYVTGVSRSLTHELIRHRHLSFSELSQRYVDVADAEVVIPPALRESMTPDEARAHARAGVGAGVRARYEDTVLSLQAAGKSRKKAREAARAFMPNMTETRIVISGNIRAWRDVLGKRHHIAADAEIAEFAGEVLKHLRELAPASVADIPNEPFTY